MEPDKLEQLVNLASETSSDRRRDLLREITDLFLTAPDSYSATENSHFGEIMGTVAFDLEQQIRVELAEKLASESAAPPDLIYKLACDDIAVAKPVLEHSPALDEQRLVAIAEQQGQGHLLAITRREDITQVVSSALVEHGDDKVVEGLIGNDKAEISNETMAEVVTRARSNDMLHAPLADRSDIPQELMADLVSHVSAELKAKILARTDMIDSKALDDAIEGVSEKYRSGANRGNGQRSKPEVLIEKMAQSGELDEAALIKFVRAGHVSEFICALARLANIDIPTAKHAIFANNHEGLAIICRALNFDRETFSIFVVAIDRPKARTLDDSYGVLRSYDRLASDTAQRILRFWRVRKSATTDTSEPPRGGQLADRVKG